MPARRETRSTDALTSLRSAHPCSAGFRGRPAADVEAAVEEIMSIQNFALQQADKLVELDVNPLLVGPEGRGAVAADALIVLEDQE